MLTQLLVATTALGLCLGLLLRRWFARRRWRRVRRVARDAEERAAGLLERAGYSIEAEQVVQASSIGVDAETVPIELRADYVVRRGSRRFVAEVKSGQLAPDPRMPATRRQLLEYWCCYDVDGVLLVDMAARRIRRITFPRYGIDRRKYRWAVVGIAVGLVAGLARYLTQEEVGKRTSCDEVSSEQVNVSR